MPTKWTPGHTGILITGAAMAVLTYLSSDPVLGVYAKPALAILTVLMGYLGITTGKGTNGVGGAKALVIPMIFVGGTWIAATAACQPGTTVPPVVITDATCLVGWTTVDLEHGMSLPAALADAASRCLGSASAENVARARSEHERATTALKAQQ